MSYKQWQDDCNRLTEPHKQWEIKKPDWSGKSFVPMTTIDFLNQCEDTNKASFGVAFIRRIDSLALPFDCDDAVNGGLVQFEYDGELITAKISHFTKDMTAIVFEWFRHVHYFEDWRNRVSELRMKESRLKTTLSAPTPYLNPTNISVCGNS